MQLEPTGITAREVRIMLPPATINAFTRGFLDSLLCFHHPSRAVVCRRRRRAPRRTPKGIRVSKNTNADSFHP